MHKFSNLNFPDGLGPFDVMADIIVGSQHGPNNSGLFGVVQSPIRPLRPSFVPSSSISSTSESHLTAAQMAQVMYFSKGNFLNWVNGM